MEGGAPRKDPRQKARSDIQELAEHEHLKRNVVVTSLQAPQSSFGQRGQIGKVFQDKDQSLVYWIMADVASNPDALNFLRVKASHTSPADAGGIGATPPAQLSLDKRTTASEAFFQRAMESFFGNHEPDVVQTHQSDEYAEIRFLDIQVREVEHRVPVENVRFLGPEAATVFGHHLDDTEGLAEAFNDQDKVQVCLWAPNHYGYLEFQKMPAPPDWDQPFAPPVVWDVTFWDSL